MTFLMVWFHDHYDQTMKKDDPQPPKCVNMAAGEIVFEDANWIRLRHAINDLEGDAETWEIHTVCKKDIIRIEDPYEDGCEQGRQDEYDDPTEPMRDESRD